MNYFPEEVLEHVFDFLTLQSDRNAVSLVCTLWFKVERYSRVRIFIGNCYATSPERVVGRFPRLKAMVLKGKPHFADFNLVPNDWGGFVQPWIEALARTCPGLEELRLKRMVVSDEGLDLLSRSFVKFKSLVLISCEGYTTDGLAAIASNCRFLRELDLQENEVEDYRGQWLSCFPQSCTSLVSLNFSCLKGDINLVHLEKLVARCPDLKRLRLNCVLPYDTLRKILFHAPQLEDLGISGFISHEHSHKLNSALQDSKCLTSLSGFFEAAPQCLPAFYMICPGLTFLNLSYATRISGPDLTKMICLCTKLLRLWILDCIGDTGLEAVGCRCKELKELRVFPFDANGGVTEKGVVAISRCCPKLSSLLYFCQQMTNEALKTVARNCSSMTRFRMCILDPTQPDPETLQPLDEGFGAVVECCKGLRRLSMSGVLTDQVFRYIGMYGKELKMISVAFAGNSDKGMVWVLNGCKKLRKLEIRDSCFGDMGLLACMGKYEIMRSLWMSGCDITYGGCREVARKMPMLNVEIFKEMDSDDGVIPDDDHRVDKMFLYRTLVGRREDAPSHVRTL